MDERVQQQPPGARIGVAAAVGIAVLGSGIAIGLSVGRVGVGRAVPAVPVSTGFTGTGAATTGATVTGVNPSPAASSPIPWPTTPGATAAQDGVRPQEGSPRPQVERVGTDEERPVTPVPARTEPSRPPQVRTSDAPTSTPPSSRQRPVEPGLPPADGRLRDESD